MNIIETIEYLKTNINTLTSNRSNECYGFNIKTDTTIDLSRSLPLIIIENNPTIIEQSDVKGSPLKQIHDVDIWAVVQSLKDTDHLEKQSKALKVMQEIITHLSQIEDYRIQKKVIGSYEGPNPIIIGSADCYGIVANYKITTKYFD